tara:strand:- start:848 stop:1282 length:435 start_codon:yes stop_codon:yes gene_type:complete
MEIKTLNKVHKEILTSFNNRIDKFIYETTEDQTEKVFKNFIPLRHKATALHNFLAKDLETKDGANNLTYSEWVFMFPNFMLFGAMGFSLSLRNGDNENEIDELTDELVLEMQDTITDLDKMLDDYIDGVDIAEKLKVLLKNKTK